MKKMLNTVLAMVFVMGFAAAGVAGENPQGRLLNGAGADQEMTAAPDNSLEDMLGEGISLERPAKRSRRINTAANDEGDMYSEGIGYQKREPEKADVSRHILAASEDNDDMYTEGLNYQRPNTTTGPAAEKPVLAASDRGEMYTKGVTNQKKVATANKTQRRPKAKLVRMPGQRRYKAPEQDSL